MKIELAKYFLILLIVTCYLPDSNSFAQITFDKTYLGSYGYSGQQTTDNGYIVAAAAATFSGPSFGLTKTDMYGDTLWTQRYGLGIGYSVQQTNDDGYIISGIKGNGAANTRIWVVKTDSNGDTMWTNTYGTASINERGRCIQQTSDGGYVIVGSSATFNSFGSTDIWLLKTDGNGDTLWSKTFGTSYGDMGFFVRQTDDNGYIITGSIWSTLNSVLSNNLCLIRTNAIGDTLWTTVLGGDLDDRGYCVQQTQDNGFIVTGQYLTGTSTDPIWNLWLIRTDANGDTIWTKIFDQSIGNSVNETADNGFIIGATKRTVTFESYLWLIKTDASGDTVWTKKFGLGMGNTAKQTDDNGYIFIGTRSGGGLRLIKTDESGMVTTLSQTFENGLPDKFELRQNFPNPFNPITSFEFLVSHSDRITISVFDIMGHRIISETRYLKPGSYTYDFDGSGYSSGIYFYQISAASGFKDTRKMLLQK